MSGSSFKYRINIKNIEDIDTTLKNKIGYLWEAVERIMFPVSFVSDKGSFMFKIKEDEENFIDTWVLVVVDNIENLLNFLNGNITYGDFISAKGNRFLILKWDLESFSINAEKEVSLSDVNSSAKHILHHTILPEDRSIIILDVLKKLLKKPEKKGNSIKIHHIFDDELFQTFQGGVILKDYNSYFSSVNYREYKKDEYNFKGIELLKDEDSLYNFAA